MVRKYLVALFSSAMLIFFVMGLSACSSDKSSQNSILKVEDANIDGTNISMFVEQDVESINLIDKVSCDSNYYWKLYYDELGYTEIPTKIAAGKNGSLKDGNNVFYIIASSHDGTQVIVYTLTIYKSYPIKIIYYNEDNILKTEFAFTGHEYTAEYVPEISGYSFNNWETETGETFTKAVIWDNISLYVNKTPNSYQLTLDPNGGKDITNSEKTVTYGEQYSLEVPVRDNYSFVGWYINDNQITNELGESLDAWLYAEDKIATAKWEGNKRIVTLNQNDSQMGTALGGGEYAYGTNVTITAQNNRGYNFVGWYDQQDKLVSKNQNYTFTMEFDVTYIAKFKKDQLLDNFIITSTPTTCTVTGIENVNITEIVVPNIVTEIQKGAFANCKLLEKITLPFIGAGSGERNTGHFGYIFGAPTSNNQYKVIPSSLKKVVISGGEFIGSDAFVACTNLESIALPDSITEIAKGALRNCSGLISVTIPFIGKTAASSYNGCLGYLFGTTRIDNQNLFIPKTLKEVTVTGGASKACIGHNTFYGCSNVERVILFDKVTSIEESAFEGCTGLTTIRCGNGIKSIEESAFEGCTSLKTVELGNNIEIIGFRAFFGCTGLTNITIPGSVIHIDGQVFYNCSSLITVVIPDSVLSIGTSAFENCNNMCYNEYDNAYYIGNEINPYTVLIKAKNSDITECKISDKTQIIHSYAFKNCKNLTNIIIPNSVIDIGEAAFMDCSRLKNSIIPNSITNINASVFRNCYELASISLPNSLITIGEYAFYNCKNLSRLEIPNSVNTIGHHAFYGCKALQSVVIPNSVKSIGDYVFTDCSGLTNVALPDSITNISGYMFSRCSNLTNIIIPSSVTKIEESAFSHCTSLTNIIIPDSVTWIDKYVFSGCTGLTSIIIPDSVKHMDRQVFSDCSNLIIYCEASKMPENWDSEWNSSNCRVYWGYSEKTNKHF